ncbi:YncE family protein [Frankia sp. AgKG'84/4]|uniref:hypothetical protein n=1 Tax=Frankia sp. AgKG'84/4 TaxID=573490 RepID=UPI00202A6362|nr:hypothetical protein [Frankia sp. AgKG'84/4]MCL9794520.1 hypothetical protein [Frankia sp. AgKG'84/4]
MFRRRLRQVLCRVAGVVLCVSIGMAVSAPGGHPITLRPTDGGVWLPWETAGVVTHLQSTTGRADAAITIPGGAGHRLSVVADGPDLLVADEDAGLLHLIEPQRLTPARTVRLPAGATLTAARGTVYVIDGPTGRIRRLDGRRLGVLGPVLDLDGALGSVAQTDDGTLWVPVRSRGTVVAVRGGVPAAPVAVAPPAHAIDVVLADGRPVVVDGTAATVTPLVGGRAGQTTALPTATAASPSSAAAVVAAPVTAASTVPVLDAVTGHLLFADVSTRTARSVSLPESGTAVGSTPSRPGGQQARSGVNTSPTGLPDIARPAGPGDVIPRDDGDGARSGDLTHGQFGPPLWHDGRVYVPDGLAEVVWVFDTRTQRFADPIRIAGPQPPGSALTAPTAPGSASTPPTTKERLTVTAGGDQVWVNDPDSPALMLIDGDRRMTLSKQPAGLAGQTGSAPPLPLPAPPPRPRSVPTAPTPAASEGQPRPGQSPAAASGAADTRPSPLPVPPHPTMPPPVPTPPPLPSPPGTQPPTPGPELTTAVPPGPDPRGVAPAPRRH